MIRESVLPEAARIVGRPNAGKADGYFRAGAGAAGPVAVKPGSAEEIQDLVCLAGERGLPVFTVRSRYVPSSLRDREGLLLDLSRMDRIIDMDKRNMKARVEAGVTYEELQRSAGVEGLEVLLPVSAVSRSVLRSNLDRDVLLGSSSFRQSNLSVFKAVLGNGEIWGSGSLQLGREGRPDFGEDQGPQLSGAFRASEDIFGIPFEATIYLYPSYETRKVLLFGFEERDGALEFIRLTARREHCFQCAGADSSYWGGLTGGDAERCAANAKYFSPWSVVVSLEHSERLVDLWAEMVTGEAADCGGRTLEGVPLELAAGALEKPWYRWEYDSLAGDAHVVDYLCYPRSAGDLFDTVETELGAKDGLTLGRVAVPISFGGSIFCETVIFVRPEQRKQVTEPALSAYRAVFEKGALIDRPAGAVAEFMFEKADAGYVRMLRLLKERFDPHGILNPGALPVDAGKEGAL